MNKQKSLVQVRIEDESDDIEFNQFTVLKIGDVVLRVATSKTSPHGSTDVFATLPQSMGAGIHLSGREEVKALHTMLGNALKCIDAVRAAESARIKAGGKAWDAGVPF